MRIVILTMLVCVAYAQQRWDLVGFENENVKCIAQHPQDTSIMVVSIADSIYRSSNGGHTWSFVTSFMGLPINAMTFHPERCDTCFALIGQGSYSDGIYRSTDTGLTWNVLSWFPFPRSICIPGWPPEFMLVGCDSLGILMSEDDGNNWDPWNEGLTDSFILCLDFSMPFDSFPIFFAGTAQGLFYKGWDGWTQANGIPINLRVSGISYDKADAIGFASVTGGSWSDGIYRSTDFGENWQVVDWWIYASCVAMNWMRFQPNDTSSVFAGDSGLGVKHSTNWGQTWQDVNSGLGNLFINALSYHFPDTTRLFCATQGGLYRYVDETGVSESSTLVSDNTIEVLSTIVRAGEPILIRYHVGDASNEVHELLIFDAVGRKIRSDTVMGNISSLESLSESGIYFIVSSHPRYYYKNKLIVID